MKRKTGAIRLFQWCLALLLVLSVAVSADWNVKKIKFKGNKTYSRRELLSLMELQPEWFYKKVKYTDFVMRSDLDVLTTFYQNRGFRSVQINAEKIDRDSSKNEVRLVIKIEEGPRTTIRNIQLLSQRGVMDSTQLPSLQSKPGQPYIVSQIREDVKKIKEVLGYKGYLEAIVEPLAEYDTDAHSALLVFHIKEGPKIQVGKIRIEGNSTLARKVVERELAFKKGDTLKLSSVVRSERRLYRTGLFNYAQVTPLLPDSVQETDLPDSSYDVKVQVSQADFFRIQTGFGYGSEEGWRTSLLSSYRNMFRQGHKLSLGGKASQIAQSAELAYSTYWLHTIPLQLETKVYYNRYDNPNSYRGIFDGLRVSLGRQTDFHVAFQTWAQWEDVQWVVAPQDTAKPKEIPDNPTQSIGASFDYDSRNDLFNPTRGIFSHLEGEVAGVYGGISNQFLKFELDSRWYWNIHSKYFFSSAIRTGYVQAYGRSDAVPAQEQFSGGGSGTVRGYTQNKLSELPGNFYLMANVMDFRFPLFWWINGALFLDAGYVWADMEDISSFSGFLKDMRFSAGPGIRVNTPLMVVRFDVGFKLDRKPGEDLYQLHFDLGNPF